MSYYTTDVRTICCEAIGRTEPVGFNDVNAVIQQAAPYVFNFDFPIFDETYRLILETKILRHFFTREIGEETVGLWKLRLCDTLNLRMPYYNQLYGTTVLQFNPLYDVDLTTDNKRSEQKQRAELNQTHEKNSGTAHIQDTRQGTKDNATNAQEKIKENESSSGNSTSRFSDTPQGSLTDIEHDRYLTNATLDDESRSSNKETSRGNSGQSIEKNNESISSDKSDTLERFHAHNGNENVNTVDEYVMHVVGTNGNRSYVSKIKELRSAILNIDEMIINELNDLFFGLWGV